MEGTIKKDEVKKKSSVKSKPKGPFIYVGPDIRSDFLLISGSIVKDKEFYISKRQELEPLFVEVADLPKARLGLQDRKSGIYRAYVESAQKERELPRSPLRRGNLGK